MTTPVSQALLFATEHPVRIVLFAASFGGVEALQEILAHLPATFPVPIVIVQHRSAKAPHLLSKVLGFTSRLPVKDVASSEQLEAGTVYVAPPTQHVIITAGDRLMLRDGQRIHHVLSSANPLFESAARLYGPGVLAVVLTGLDSDAAEGALAVKKAGGIVLAQDEATSKSFEMPRAAIASNAVNAVLPLKEIGNALVRLTSRNASLP